MLKRILAPCVLVLLGALVVQMPAVHAAPRSTQQAIGRGYASDGYVPPGAAPAASSAPSASSTASTTLPGVDVSNWQGSINWTKAAGDGKRFAFMKATEGRTYTDPTYATNRQNAVAAGFVIGAYHFARPDSSAGDAVAEADHFANVADVHVGDIIPVLDLERDGGLSRSALINWTEQWLQEVKRRTGVKPMIYTGPYRWSTVMGNTTKFADEGYRLWLADWTTGSPWVPANDWGGRGWTFWQYTDCGHVNGISGCTDLDRYKSLNILPVRVPRLTVSTNGVGKVTSSPSGINCGSDCASVFNPGSTVTLTGTPSPGAVLVRWEDSCSGNAGCSVKMVGNHSVNAVFGYTLSASVSGLGVGSVTSSPKRINCGNSATACSAAFAANVSVTLTATPQPGSQFSSWGGACSGWELTCTVDMTAARSVTAEFADDTPPTATIRPPSRLRSPAVAIFDEPVHHVTTSDFVVHVESGTSALPATVTCLGQYLHPVSCATGDVARAVLRPEVLVPGQSYVAEIDPPGAPTSVVDRAGNPAATTPQPFRAATSLEESDLATGWRWGTVWNRRASGHSYETANAAGASAGLTFSGPTVRWVTVTGPDQGLAHVLIDGRGMGVFDLSGSTMTFGVGHRFGDLGQGTHTIRVVVVGKPGRHGPAGTSVAVDEFDVNGTPAPDGSVSYRWGSIERPGASGGAEAVASARGASLTLPFRGTAIRWITEKQPNGGKADVYLDGHLLFTYDGYSPTLRLRVSRGIGGLTDSVHVLRIVALGTARPASRGTSVWVDAFDIT